MKDIALIEKMERYLDKLFEHSDCAKVALVTIKWVLDRNTFDDLPGFVEFERNPERN